MRKTLTIIVLLIVAIAFTSAAYAENIIFENVTAEQAVFKEKDRNGNPYIRFIVPKDRETGGIKYTDRLVVMAFSSTAGLDFEYAKSLKPGDKFTAVVKPREYQGNVSYTILKFDKTATAQ